MRLQTLFIDLYYPAPSWPFGLLMAERSLCQLEDFPPTHVKRKHESQFACSPTASPGSQLTVWTSSFPWWRTTHMGSFWDVPFGSRGTIWKRRKSVSLMAAFSGQMSSMSSTLSLSKSPWHASPRPLPGKGKSGRGDRIGEDSSLKVTCATFHICKSTLSFLSVVINCAIKTLFFPSNFTWDTVTVFFFKGASFVLSLYCLFLHILSSLLSGLCTQLFQLHYLYGGLMGVSGLICHFHERSMAMHKVRSCLLSGRFKWESRLYVHGRSGCSYISKRRIMISVNGHNWQGRSF